MTSIRTRSSRRMTPLRSRTSSKRSPRRPSSPRSLAGSAFTVRPPRTVPSFTLTPDRGKHAGNGLLVVFLDFLLFRRHIDLDILDADVVCVPETAVFFDAEHAAAQTLFQRPFSFSFLIAALGEIRPPASLWWFVGAEVAVRV